jgi:hypothetical protein
MVQKWYISDLFKEYKKGHNGFNPSIRPKCPSQNMIWFVLKLCGVGFNTRPKLIYFEPMFLGLWLRVILE